jgi:hypothetical protein
MRVVVISNGAPVDAEKDIIGHKIIQIRPMTDGERDIEGWSQGTMVLVLDNQICLFAAQDEEGNDHGEMFGHNIVFDRFGIYWR